MAQTVTPYLLYEDAGSAVGFLAEAFGFREVTRMTGEGGGIHVEMEVTADGGRIYVGQPEGGFDGPGTVGRTSLTYILVDDVDGHHVRAVDAGATVIEEPTDVGYGARRYTCDDPQGHQWCFATPHEEGS